jgi:MFS family permease
MSRTRVPILSLFAANAVSLSGNMAALVAIPWFVLQTTGSASKTGITAFAALLPVVLSGFFGGALVDRLGYRRMSIVGDLASAVSVAAIPILHSTVGLEFWQLVVLVFLGGLLDAPGGTARASLLPDVAERAGWTLERASGLTAVIERASRLAGAPLAGVLIAVVGATNVLWIDAVSFVISAALVAIGVPRPARRPAPETKTRYVHELREGFRFLRRDRTLATLIGVVTLTNLLDSVALVLLPVYAVEVYASSLSLGLMWAAVGAGSILGALAFAARGDRVSRRAVYTWGFIMVSVWYPVAATFPPLAVLLAAKVASGIASGPINPLIDTVFYERVPDGMRGRVLGVTQALAWVAMPLGVLVAGPLIEGLGLRPTLLISFALYLLVTVGSRFMPSLRDLDRRPAEAAEDGEILPSTELAPVAGGTPWAGPAGEREMA